MDSVLLIGDSITEQGYCSGWISRISDALVRRAYVVNSGLSGYNTRWMLEVLRDPKRCESVIPSWVREPLFVTILLGSNDCAEGGQNVPIPEFCENLRAIVDLVLAKTNPKGGVFVLTLPPVQQELWNASRPDALRQYGVARLYRRATLQTVRDLSSQHPLRVFAVDTQQAFLRYGAPQATESEMDVFDARGAWTSLLVDDGLHINSLGGSLFSATLLQVVRGSPKGSSVLQNDESLWPLPSWRTMMLKNRPEHK
ncbi:GDSL-like Lipase/Acylhydrolase/GDSL-like Lipase/Acylhydrolase family [Novymonas esmeraldas]|uniref:GDSL-like Lipase/Acylhydrolase/GDSL-like Lipase/Acylhydrolase family n=1 Tax=Novymonas esmeraldas TaxID=1808958 RepID=A0AAW0F1E9_9TRYP